MILPKIEVRYLHFLIIFLLSIVIGFIFLNVNKDICMNGNVARFHSEIGYNFYKENSVKVNYDRINYAHEFITKEDKLLDYADFDADAFDGNKTFLEPKDTVGYGVLLGLIWKITGSFRHRDIRILQIIIFSLIVVLFYMVVFLLFNSYSFSLLCSFLLLSFTPLSCLNAQAHRDIWAFYGGVIILFSLLKFFKNNGSVFSLLIGGIAFTLCQWIRSPVFFCLPSLLIVFWFFYKKNFLKAFLVLGLVNVFLFWLPFAVYNKIAHGDYIASCAGHGLLVGLGGKEKPNKWGFLWDDNDVAKFVKSRSGMDLKTHSIEYDAMAKQLFWELVREDPKYFIGVLLSRTKEMFCCKFGFSFFLDNFMSGGGFLHKVKAALKEPVKFVLKLTDFIYNRLFFIELYVLLGWLGLLVMFFRKKYFETFIIFAAMAPFFAIFTSHIEGRYLIVVYWVLSIPLAYFLYCAKDLFLYVYSKVVNIISSHN